MPGPERRKQVFVKEQDERCIPGVPTDEEGSMSEQGRDWGGIGEGSPLRFASVGYAAAEGRRKYEKGNVGWVV
jgi:hypothetical protein